VRASCARSGRGRARWWSSRDAKARRRQKRRKRRARSSADTAAGVEVDEVKEREVTGQE